jgi:hypothetical protein
MTGLLPAAEQPHGNHVPKVQVWCAGVDPELNAKRFARVEPGSQVRSVLALDDPVQKSVGLSHSGRGYLPEARLGRRATDR